MKCLITGAGGLVGSECVKYFCQKGWQVIGVDNNYRKEFFGEEGSVYSTLEALQHYENFRLVPISITDLTQLTVLFNLNKFDAIIHAAAQPSHDKAASIPFLDFHINATGTLNLLELTRQYCSSAPFIFTSTNKVYGDQPNQFGFIEKETRYCPADEALEEGFDEYLSIDQCTHSLFGCSKAAADLYCQEYGKYFGLKTCIFRLGCITGSNHKGAKLHGFLNYLVKCVLSDTEYEIIGFRGKQVRDQIHAKDLVRVFDAVIEKPVSGEVFNMGGGLTASCSVLEAIEIIERLTGKKVKTTYNPKARIGDHQWYISNTTKFQNQYDVKLQYDIESIIREIIDNS